MPTLRPATVADLDAITALAALPELTWGDGQSLSREDFAAHLPSDVFLVVECVKHL